MKKLSYILLGAIIMLTSTVYAVQISVPSATGSGKLLQSLTNGTYAPASLIAGSNVTISTTTSTITISSTGGGTWATTTSTHSGRLINYPLNATDIVTIGSNATTSAEYYFDPNTLFAYLSGRTSLQYASTTALTSTGSAYFATSEGNVGIGTTTPTGKFDVIGFSNLNTDNIIAAYANNLSQGFAVRYDGLYAVGSNANVDINFVPKGTGAVILGGTASNLTQSNSTTNLLTQGTSGSVYAYGNSINGRYSTNSNGLLYINYVGYNGGVTQFRDTQISNGQQGNIAFFQGSTGNVGIGTTSPFAKLSVDAPAGQTSFAIGSSTATSFIVDKNGNVGVGTVSPTSKLEVSGNTSLGSGTTWYTLSAGNINLYGGNQAKFSFDTSDPSFRIGSASIVKWSTTAGSNNGTYDLGLYRGAAGKLYVGNGTVGDYTGTLVAGNVGIGTTTPMAQLSLQLASSTAGTAQSTPFGRVFAFIIGGVRYMVETFDYYGHRYTSGPAPVLSSCGTSPSFVGSANDSDMVVQVGSVSATGCTITFAYPYLTAPRVNVTNRSSSVTNAMTYTVSATQIVISQTGLTGAILDIGVAGTR